MASIDTTKVRQDWVDKTLEELGTVSRFADRLGVPPSTAARWIEPGRTLQADLSVRFLITSRSVLKMRL